jgi:hypothetical protein
MMNMRSSSSRDPHEPYVREALAHMRGLHDDHAVASPDGPVADAGEHHFALPTIKPVSVRSSASSRAREFDRRDVAGGDPVPTETSASIASLSASRTTSLTNADVSAYRTPSVGSATIAALLLQRAGAGVGDRSLQGPATREHVPQIGRRRAKTTVSFEAVEDRIGLRGTARRPHARESVVGERDRVKLSALVPVAFDGPASFKGLLAG